MESIEKIYNLLNQPFYLKYEFWFALVNFVFLIFTALATRKNSKVINKIQFESLKQRILDDAKDVTFKMQKNYNCSPKNDSSDFKPFTFGVLTTPINNTVIAKFTFLDNNFDGIGKTTLFFEHENSLQGNIQYSPVEMNKIKETLITQDGFIKAKVIASNGSEFIYTYHAFSENWKKGDGNDIDDFVLVLKQIDDEFIKKVTS